MYEGVVYRLRIGHKTPFLITSSIFALPYTEHMKRTSIYSFKLIFSGVLNVNVAQKKEV